MIGAKKKTEGRRNDINLLKWHSKLFKTVNVNFLMKIMEF